MIASFQRGRGGFQEEFCTIETGGDASPSPRAATPDGDMRLAEGQEHEHRRCVVPPTVHCIGIR